MRNRALRGITDRRIEHEIYSMLWPNGRFIRVRRISKRFLLNKTVQANNGTKNAIAWED